MKKSIELDVAFEDAVELIELTQDAAKRGIELIVIDPSAQYNRGWPVIEFSGDGQELLEFLDGRGFDFSPDDLQEVVDEVTN